MFWKNLHILLSSAAPTEPCPPGVGDEEPASKHTVQRLAGDEEVVGCVLRCLCTSTYEIARVLTDIRD